MGCSAGQLALRPSLWSFFLFILFVSFFFSSLRAECFLGGDNAGTSWWCTVGVGVGFCRILIL